MRHRYLAIMAVGILIPVVPAGVAAAPKNDHAIVQSGKKPGKTCGDLSRGSSAYKQCIQTQAHIGQKPKKKP